LDKKLKISSILGILIVFGLGAFWHFLYQLAPSSVTGAISPVNESPWEHVKLFFVPAIIVYTILYFVIGKQYPNFLFAHSIALLIMPVFMLLFYYTYESLVDETIVFDLINSFLTAALGSAAGYKLTTSDLNLSTPWHKAAAIFIVLAMFVIYVSFTFNPPDCDMFKVRD